jgi:ribosomal subunit interface protein
MNINIHSTTIELTDAILKYANKKVESLFKMLHTEDESISIELKLNKISSGGGDTFKTEINLYSKISSLHLSAKTDDLYEGIDAVKDEVLRSLRKEKTKLERRRKI